MRRSTGGNRRKKMESCARTGSVQHLPFHFLSKKCASHSLGERQCVFYEPRLRQSRPIFQTLSQVSVAPWLCHGEVHAACSDVLLLGSILPYQRDDQSMSHIISITFTIPGESSLQLHDFGDIMELPPMASTMHFQTIELAIMPFSLALCCLELFVKCFMLYYFTGIPRSHCLHLHVDFHIQRVIHILQSVRERPFRRKACIV